MLAVTCASSATVLLFSSVVDRLLRCSVTLDSGEVRVWSECVCPYPSSNQHTVSSTTGGSRHTLVTCMRYFFLLQSFSTAAAAAAAYTKCRRCGLAISQSQRSRFCPPRSARTAAFTAITVSSHSFLFFKRERERKVCLLKDVCRMPFSINYLYSWGHILLRGCFCLLSDVLGLASFWLLLEQRQQQQQHQLNWWVS